MSYGAAVVAGSERTARKSDGKLVYKIKRNPLVDSITVKESQRKRGKNNR